MKLLTSYTGKHRKHETEELRMVPLCPWCGGFVGYELSCDGFEDRGDWWIHETCDKAVKYFCWGMYQNPQTCTWLYVNGINQRHPVWDANEDRRPTWISAGQPPYDDEGYLWTVPGVEERRLDY
jgi:hypothetical protein